MKNNIYYIHTDVEEEKNAGSKAVRDCEKIMEKRGYKVLSIYSHLNCSQIISKMFHLLQLFKFFLIPYGSILVIKHPIYKGNTYLRFLKLSKAIKKIKLVFLIHDIESERMMFDDSSDFYVKDNFMYKYADFIIAHNDAMKKFLVSKGVLKDKIVTLSLFDYLATEPQINIFDREADISVAGNLSESKCKYIYDLIDNVKELKIQLYGVGLSKYYINKCDYKGSFSPENLVHMINSKYGLVWDGTSIYTCNGSTGKYLKINNPHKLSLFIASKVPVIIWKHAAEARFVEENKIGFCVDSLNEIKKIIDMFDVEEYKKMVCNIEKLSKKVRTGFFLNEKLKDMEMKLK